MTSKEDLFERFGKQLIEMVRDNRIHFIEGLLDQKSPSSVKFKDQLDQMSSSQIEMVKQLGAQWVDATLHDLLYMLEDAKWIHLRLEGENAVVEDIRQAARGDLQAYIYIWAEKYSTKRLTG